MKSTVIGFAVVAGILLTLAAVVAVIFLVLVGQGIIQHPLVHEPLSWAVRIGMTLVVVLGFGHSIGLALERRCQVWAPGAWSVALLGIAIFWIAFATMEPPSPYAMEDSIRRYQTVNSLWFLLLVGGFVGGVMGSSRPPSPTPYPDEDLA